MVMRELMIWSFDRITKLYGMGKCFDKASDKETGLDTNKIIISSIMTSHTITNQRQIDK